MPDLARFLEAQEDSFDRALAEIGAGRKTGHWMWFVFPQLRGLGRSPVAQLYGIADAAEAAAYLAHPVLGARLERIAAALLAHAGTPAEAILGPVDALKLCSSMTLFAAVPGAPPVFAQVLAAFCDGPCRFTRQALA